LRSKQLANGVGFEPECPRNPGNFSKACALMVIVRMGPIRWRVPGDDWQRCIPDEGRCSSGGGHLLRQDALLVANRT
jgi:hypothetical protein